MSIKTARGVPKPDDDREADILSRQVRVCLVDENHEDGFKIIGNVHRVIASWSKLEEDVWQFSKAATGNDDYKLLVRGYSYSCILYSDRYGPTCQLRMCRFC